MAGLRGQSREPNHISPRERRNSQNLASQVRFIDPDSPITIDGSGRLQLTLTAAGGLVVVSSALGILLDPAGEDFLVLSAAGLDIDEDELYSFVNYYG